MNVNDHIRRLEERLLAWDAEIVRLNSALQLEKDKNETLQKSYSRTLKFHDKTAKHLRRARRIKKNMQYSLDLRDSEIQDLTYQILKLEEDERFYQKKIDQLNHENSVLSTDLSIEELHYKHSRNANVKLYKLTDKHILHLRKARAAKKDLQERIFDSERNANEYAKRFHQKEKHCDELVSELDSLKERYEEVVSDALEFKAKVEALEKENKKWETLYDRTNDQVCQARNDAQDYRARAIVAERELEAQKTDTLNLVRMLSVNSEE